MDGSKSEALKTAEGVKKVICNETNIESEERSDYLQVRCGVWWMPELAEKAHELRFTPAGVKIYEHWWRTKDVYYLRRNYERFMTMRPWSWQEREDLRSADVEGFVFPEDHSTDGQFLDDIGRRKPGPNVKSVSYTHLTLPTIYSV